jgi:hypothetical protein
MLIYIALAECLFTDLSRLFLKKYPLKEKALNGIKSEYKRNINRTKRRPAPLQAE